MSGTHKPKKKPSGNKVNPGQAKSNSSMLDDDPDSITSLRTTMEGIGKQIHALQTDLKADLRAFKDEITTQMKREVSELRADIPTNNLTFLERSGNIRLWLQFGSGNVP